MGVLRSASPAAVADSGIAGPRWRMSIGALWAAPQTITLGPGTVRQGLISGFSRTCFAPWTSGSLRIDVCSGAAFGLMTGEGHGYSRNERRTEPWVAIPFELAFAGFRSPVGWELSGGGLGMLRRRDFSIDGLGVGYRSSPVAATLTLRVVGLLPL